MDEKVNRKKHTSKFVTAPDDNMIICRCEEITKGEIRRAIYDGMMTMGEVRKYLRTGMGLCQGQTCSKLVKGILARELGTSVENIKNATSRSPARPIEMHAFSKEGGEGHA